MSSNSGRSKIHGQSSYSVHSLHSLSPERKEEILHPHSQLRTQAVRAPSYVPNRLSHIPSPNQLQEFHNQMAYPARDLSYLSHRTSMVHTFEPNAFRRSYSDNLSSMQASRASFQAFATRDQTRDTLQSYAKPSNGQPGTHPNRASRLPEMPRRPNAEPANLIHSIRNSTYGNTPKSSQVDSKRVVTGILQSALPPSARPPPVNTTPQRSMSIAELEKRHKAAMQKLQTHNIHSVAKTAKPSQPQPVKHRHKPAPQANQELPSVASSKIEKVEKAETPLNVPPRRHFFSFGSLIHKPKPSKPTGEPVKSKKDPPSKKAKETLAPPIAVAEAEDEDVPLAQLRDRRASYNPVSQTATNRESANFRSLNSSMLCKSFSVPADVNKLEERETLDLKLIAHEGSRTHGTDSIRSKYSNSENYPVGNKSISESRNFELVNSFPTIPKPPASTPDDKLMPELTRQSSWLHANFELSEEEKHGPRPLIFEDEAKAIRNSRRLWLQ